jgi:hypothetical protein
MPTAAWTISWRHGWLRAALPIAVHCVAAAAVVCVAVEYAWAWIFGGAVIGSAIRDVHNLRREHGRLRTLTVHGPVLTIDGIPARVERAWLGPGLTVVRLRVGKRSEMLSAFRRELVGSDHAALRRYLREIDFR